MGDILQFKKPPTKKKSRDKTLCNSGFHKWEIDKNKPFETRQGKLLSRYVCARCGKVKTEAR